jgi:hypothetical protein
VTRWSWDVKPYSFHPEDTLSSIPWEKGSKTFHTKEEKIWKQKQSPDTVAIQIPQGSNELLAAISLLASLDLLREVWSHKQLLVKQMIEVQPNVGQNDATWHLCRKLCAKWTEPHIVCSYVLSGTSIPFQKISFPGKNLFPKRGPQHAKPYNSCKI